jgi:hypothetical protein
LRGTGDTEWDAHAEEDASDEEHGDIDSGGLEDDTDKEDDRSDGDTVLSAEFVVDVRYDGQREDGTDTESGIDDTKEGTLGVVEVCCIPC